MDVVKSRTKVMMLFAKSPVKIILFWFGVGVVLGLLDAFFISDPLELAPRAGIKEALLSCMIMFLGIIAVIAFVGVANRSDICPRQAMQPLAKVLAFFRSPLVLFEAASAMMLGIFGVLWIAQKFKTPDVFVPLCASLGVFMGTQALRMWCQKRAKDEQSSG